MTHLSNIFKEACEARGWNFDYGTKDYLNLNDYLKSSMLPDQVCFMCDPITIVQNRNEETNAIEEERSSGAFIFAFQADIDTKYDEKLERYILPLKEQLDTFVNEDLRACTGLTILQWRITEVVDLFDTNVTGLIVQFEIKNSFI